MTDRCRELDVDVTPVNAGEKAANSEDFADLGSEMCWRLREAFRETYELVRSGKDDPSVGISIPDDPILVHQLSGRKYDYRSDGRIRVESKDSMRRRGERSPDRADALAIAWWAKTQRQAPPAMISGEEVDALAAGEGEEWDWRAYDRRGHNGIMAR